MTRHRFDAFSFLAGATAVTVGVLVLLDAVSLRIVDLRVIGPVLLLGFGLALLLGGGSDQDVTAVSRGGGEAADDPIDDVSHAANGRSPLDDEDAHLASDPHRQEPGAEGEPG